MVHLIDLRSANTHAHTTGFLWNVVMLAMGGLGLGEAVKSSGLLQAIAQEITKITTGLDLYTMLLIFCLLVLFCTTFISHTVSGDE